MSICCSLYYKHDFAVISSAGGFSTNYIAADFVKYSENILHCILLHKYFYRNCARSDAKLTFKVQTSNCLNILKNEIPNRIGGGQHGASIEKVEMNVICPFVVSAPMNFSDIKMCEFVEHLEMSKGLKKYNGSDYVFCNMPLHRLLCGLFQNSRIAIGHKHDIHISRKMTKSKVTELFKNHDSICEHNYVTVFRPYMQYSSSERSSKYRKVQKSQDKNISGLKLPEDGSHYHRLKRIQVKNISELNLPKCSGENVVEHNTFPPDPPNVSLRRKIVKDFCDAIKHQDLKKEGVLCVVHSL